LIDSISQRFFIVKKLPEDFLRSLEGVEGFDRQSFEKLHESGEQVTSIRINPLKTTAAPLFVQDKKEKIPWSQYGFYLEQRPSFTFDPFFHAGLYYVQEASSMFLEQAFRQLVDPDRPIRVLDLCAAPGGKSTHIQSLISKGKFSGKQ
jgi:16S rRNA C967 or C1407 C5-methylase (RsmB/RsmF family)